jgi:hypothetical protein
LSLHENNLTGTFPVAMCQFNYNVNGVPRVDCDKVECSCCQCWR